MADDKKLHEFDVEVFATGKWNGGEYTEKDIDELIKNFDALKETVKPPVKLGHNEQQMKDIMKDGQPALGWVKALKKQGQKLIATLTQVPEVVFKAIKNGLYKRVSSEFYQHYRKDGKDLGKVYCGLALLGADIPAVDTLADLEVYLSQSMQDASFEGIEVHEFAVDAGGKIIERKESSIMEDKEREIFTKQISDLQALVDQLKPGADEAKKFKAELDEMKKKFSDDLKASQKDKLTTFAEQMVKDGKLPPAFRDALLKDFDKNTFSEGTGYSIPIDNVIGALKTFEKVILKTDEKALGDDKNNQGDKDVFTVVKEKVAEFQAKNPKATLTEATAAVLNADKDLAEKYFSTSTSDE